MPKRSRSDGEVYNARMSALDVKPSVKYCFYKTHKSPNHTAQAIMVPERTARLIPCMTRKSSYSTVLQQLPFQGYLYRRLLPQGTFPHISRGTCPMPLGCNFSACPLPERWFIWFIVYGLQLDKHKYLCRDSWFVSRTCAPLLLQKPSEVNKDGDFRLN